jgi:hypothetical protein
MFLESDIYSPAGGKFRIRTEDLAAHVSWMLTINAKLPTGSKYFIEIGHNGNGNIEVPRPVRYHLCRTNTRIIGGPECWCLLRHWTNRIQ